MGFKGEILKHKMRWYSKTQNGMERDLSIPRCADTLVTYDKAQTTYTIRNDSPSSRRYLSAVEQTVQYSK